MRRSVERVLFGVRGWSEASAPRTEARSPRFEVRLEVRRGEVKLRDSRSESEVRGLMSEIGSRLKVKVPGSRSVKILPGIALRDQYGQTASGGSIPCWFTVSLKW